MPLMKTTWITQLQRHSFSESWFRMASTADPTVEVVAARQYAATRALLLGYPCVIYAIRISNVDDRRQKTYLEYVNYPGNFTQTTPGTYDHSSAASNVALNMEFQNATNTQDKLLQLRGIWDDVEIQGGAWDFTNPIYTPLIQGFGAKVVQLEYGWRYTSSVNKKDIVGYTQSSTGLITFTLGAAFFTVDQVNAMAHVPVRISGCNDSPNLNGQLTVIALSPTTCVTLRPIAVRPFVGGGFMQRNLQDFTRAFGGRIQRIGKRQAGAPLLQSVGRGRVRARG